jgi:peptidoglycan hydrolase-like protein with peptidoglycan-binding domain
METPFGFGGQPRTVDKRDYPITAFAGLPVTKPDSYSSHVPKIFMQSKFVTCGAHMGAQIASIIYGKPLSPKYLWKQIKQIDGFGLNDGTDIRSVFKALQSGTCEYDLMPNPSDGEYPQGYTIEQYSDISEVTQAQKDNAKQYSIPNYALTYAPTLEDIKTAIYQHKCVGLLVDCGDGWYTPSWANSDVNPLHTGNFVAHHFITASSYGLTLIDGANSWSMAWGDNGMFHFLENYLPHVLEMGVPIMPDVATYKFNNDLYFGMRNNPDVHALQVRLNVLPATGNFGFITLGAVQKYQRANGIVPSFGYVGLKTRAQLNM